VLLIAGNIAQNIHDFTNQRTADLPASHEIVR